MLRITGKDGTILAVTDSAMNIPDGISFYGDTQDWLQVGAFKHKAGRVLRAHSHLPQPERISWKTQEILIVFSGSLEVTIYDLDDEPVHTQVLFPMDFVISYWGGIGGTVLENGTVILEPKNGPFIGDSIERRLVG